MRVLLRGNGGDMDDEIADAVGTRVATAASVRKRFAADGPGAAPVG